MAALARHDDVRVLALHYPYARGDYSAFGAAVHALGGANVSGPARGRVLLRGLTWTVREHRRRPADVLHALWADEAGAVAVAAGRALRTPAVVSLMGGELVDLGDIRYGGQRSLLGRRLAPRALRHADRVTVGSDSLHRRALPYVRTGRLARLPLGVDTSFFRPGSRPEPGPLAGRTPLLCVASLTPVKDHATLLRALARAASHADVHLHVVGDGPLRAGLEHEAVRLGVARRVTFHGAVPHDRLPDYYRAAHLLVVSSRYESQSMVTFEAAACGCPVVGTAVGALPELPGARTVPVGDHAALAEAIVAAVADARDLAGRGHTSLEAVRAEFALERCVPRLRSLYEDVARG